MDQLYRTEKPVKYGTNPDRYRSDDQVYEISGLMSSYTLVAASDKIAIAAVLFAGIPFSKNYVIAYPFTTWEIPWDEVTFNLMFGGLLRFTDFVIENYNAVIAALKSVLPGNRLERKSVLENGLPSPDFMIKWIAKRLQADGSDLFTVAQEAAKDLETHRESNLKD